MRSAQKYRGVARFHVGHAYAVDEFLVDFSGPGIDGPTFGDGVGVNVAVEQQALAPARAAPAADGVDAVARHWRQRSVQAQGTHLVSHERRQCALAVGLAIAFVLHHAGQEFEAGGLVNRRQKLFGGHGGSLRGRKSTSGATVSAGIDRLGPAHAG